MRISDWSSDVCSSDLPHSRRTWLRPRKSPLRGAASVHRRGVKVGARVVHRQHVSTLEQQTMENTMNHANKLSGLIALAPAAAMPMDFAPTAPTTAARRQPTPPPPTPPTAHTNPVPRAQRTAPTTDDGMQPTSPQATAPTAEPKQVTWADLDVDKDGSLSKAEVATVPALTQVFDAADADADGKLTAEEYKAHAAATSGEADDASEQ